MGIEDDIKQAKGFRNERQKALINIIYTEGWLRDLISGMLKPHGLTGQQYNVLRILRGSSPGPLSTSCIRNRMLDKMSDASRIVDRLFKKNLVERGVCCSDKRLVDVRITEKGLEVLKRIDEAEVSSDQFLSSISEDEATKLNEILDKVRAGA